MIIELVASKPDEVGVTTGTCAVWIIELGQIIGLRGTVNPADFLGCEIDTFAGN